MKAALKKKKKKNQQPSDGREEQHVVENVGHGGCWKKKPVAYPANQEKPALSEYTAEAAEVARELQTELTEEVTSSKEKDDELSCRGPSGRDAANRTTRLQNRTARLAEKAAR